MALNMLMFLSLLITTLHPAKTGIDMFEITCTTLPSQIHVTKEDFDVMGNVLRTCEGTLVTSKCEGTCESRVKPSVLTPSGFLKECQCCKEATMVQKDVQLKECYDTDGQRLFGKTAVMTIRLQEPKSCNCYKCGM
ncbi:partner of bursicon-like [Limulus polyphemus]|uniref:Partner of bursicon-like n=1 Tax=Limulus polyphemus TaxID=6850 RepID=A0ABM1SZ88_LIMPO|nr:partner of bursicon-like [Limulus polyphemus]XP_022248945.1 partner of bursicon-like [Limulus polyphemus]